MIAPLVVQSFRCAQFLFCLSVALLLVAFVPAAGAPFNIAPDGDAVFGVGADMSGGDDVPLVHWGPVIEINDQVFRTGSDGLAPDGYVIGPDPDTVLGPQSNGVDTCCDVDRGFDFVGILFPDPVSNVTGIRVQNFLANDGGWWGPATDAAGGAALAAGEIAPPQVQVTTNGGASWTDVGGVTDDYVTQLTGTIRGSGFPASTRTPFATLNFAAQNGIDGIRLIGDGAGAAGGGDNPGFIAVTEMMVLQDTGTVFPTLDIDTNTGELTLHTGTGTAREIQGYRITSSENVGAIDPSGWLSIAENYDQGNTGPDQVDPDNPWTELSSSTSRTSLSESELSGGDGGSLGSGLSLSLGSVWIQNPFGNDIQMELLLPDGRMRRVEVTYDGMSENSLLRGDMNFDGVIDSSDWPIVRDNFNTEFAALTPAEAYALGDLNGDGVNNAFDFAEFKAEFDAANGDGAFAAMIAGVPEPSSIAMWAIGVVLTGCWRRRRRW